MGAIHSSIKSKFGDLFNAFRGRKSGSIIILGLDGAGKTTLVNLLSGVTTPTTPTIGFSLEEVVFNNTFIRICDIGGQSAFIKFWNKYVQTMDGLVFMIDICDDKRFENSFKAFSELVPDLKEGSSVLLLLNKADKMKSTEEVQEAKERIEKMFHISQEGGSSSNTVMHAKHGDIEKQFKTKVFTLSVLGDIERMKNDPSVTIAHSGVYKGFDWLVQSITKSK